MRTSKQITKILCLLAVFIIGIFCSLLMPKTLYASPYVAMSSEAVLEVSSGRTLFEKNSRIKMPMASTTKVVTAITVIEHCNLNELVAIEKKMVGIEGSSIYLVEGEHLTVLELLYGLMLRSGNDCAVALAIHTAGSIEKFADMMIETAQKVGANDSNFVNPHGLHDDNHYTTAYDLALISAYAMKNETFKKIVSTKSVKISNEKGSAPRLLINKNKMLSNYEGANGIKTGFTKKAGRCLVSAAERNGMQLVSVVLNCGDMWEESSKILDAAFIDYTMTKVFDCSRIIDAVKVKNRNKTCGIYAKNDIVLPLKEEEKNNISIKYEYDSELTAPVKKDEKCGNIYISLQNCLLFSQNIYTINNIE